MGEAVPFAAEVDFASARRWSAENVPSSTSSGKCRPGTPPSMLVGKTSSGH